MTVEFVPTATFDMSLNDVAVSEPVKVVKALLSLLITTLLIVTAPNAWPASAMIVVAAGSLEKSSAAPSPGTTPPAQFLGLAILPSSPSPTQVLAGGTLPT